MTTEIVHRSAGLVIRHARRGTDDGGGPLVVTFSDMFDKGWSSPDEAFGWRWLERNGVSQISVCAEHADWFQTEGFMEGMAAVASRIAQEGAERVSLYGLSMGGFAAMLAAPLLKPGRILAAAAQFSVDPAVVPWERRFHPQVAAIGQFLWAVAPEAGTGSEVLMLHDPIKRPDRRHVRLFGRGAHLMDVPVHGGRHNVIAHLVARGAAPALLAQLRQDAPAGALRQYIRGLRRRDGIWRRKMEKAMGAERVAAILASCARLRR